MATTAKRTERLPPSRIRPRERVETERAAEIAGEHLAEFVRVAVLDRVRRILQETYGRGA